MTTHCWRVSSSFLAMTPRGYSLGDWGSRGRLCMRAKAFGKLLVGQAPQTQFSSRLALLASYSRGDTEMRPATLHTHTNNQTPSPPHRPVAHPGPPHKTASVAEAGELEVTALGTRLLTLRGWLLQTCSLGNLQGAGSSLRAHSSQHPLALLAGAAAAGGG